MSTITAAEYCAGYGGLALAVEQAFGATTVQVSEIDPAACKVLARRFPGAVNIGDMTRITPGARRQVHIMSGGTPCQDISAAGKRAGMVEGTRSNLWTAFRNEIAETSPVWVVWENVRGAFSARAESASDSAVVTGQGPVGDSGGGRGPVLRALGRVLGDLSDLGYDTEWRLVRASDVGAPHARARVFVLARRRDASYAESFRWAEGRPESAGILRGHDPALSGPANGARPGVAILPTPRASDSTGVGEHGTGGLDLRTTITLLPTPQANLGTNGGSQEPAHRAAGGHSVQLHDVVEHVLLPTPSAGNFNDGEDVDAWDARRQRVKETAANGNGMGEPLATAAQRLSLLPTPKASDGEWGLPRTSGRPPEAATHLATALAFNPWGKYAAAIHRWEQATGRQAPPATVPRGRAGAHRLNPVFVEWLMGLPDGWVTDPGLGLSPSQQLTALGNGVVPQQAAYAITDMLTAYATEQESAA